MASYNNLAPTQVKYGNGSEGGWHDPISSSGGKFAFGRSGQGHFVTFMIFKLPTSVSNITKIELTLYAHGTVSGTYTTIAKLVKNGQGPSNTSNPANWYSYPGLSTSNTVSASYSSNLSKRTYTFSSGLSTLTGGETIWVWLQGDSSSSYSEGRWSSSYPIYLNITYGGTTPTNYTITYYRNFSTSDNTKESGGTVASGTYYVLKDCDWTRQGYSFNGWVASRSSSVIYNPGAEVQALKNQTWYATWVQNVTQYTVKFYPGNHATVSNTPANAITRYTENGSLTLLSNTAFTGQPDYTYYTTNYYLQGGDVTSYNYPSSSSHYTRSGSSSNYCYSVEDDKKTDYNYEYWYGSDTSGVRKCGDTYNNLNQDINMWPNWTGTTNYNAQFNPPNASRTGYRLSGWATRPTGTPNYESGTNYQQSSNQNLYAIWEADQVYINYYTDNDTAQPTNTVVQGPYDVGDRVQLSNGSDWFSSKWGSSVTFYTDYNFQGGSFSNGVTPNSTYSVSRTGKYDWVISGWLHGSQHYELSDWITLDSNISLYPYWADSSSIVSHAKFTPITPIRKGYKFLNWNTQANGNGTAYYANTEYDTSAIDKNLTLYAIWEPEWTIKINNGTNWGDYHVWIYTGATSNNGWQQAIPYVYDGSNWKLTKI